MNLIKSIGLSLIIIISSILLGVFVIEILLRTFSSQHSLSKTEVANILRNFNFEYKIDGLYESESNFITYSRNEFGLRDNCNSPEEIDILTVGGSTTDQRYVKLESTFQSVLEKKIIDHIKKDICISNAGVDGHTTFGHIYSFKNWFPLIPNLKPKYVILYIGINDADFRLNGKNKGYDINNNYTIKGFAKNFYIIQKLMPLIRYLRDKMMNQNLKYANHSKVIYTHNDYISKKINSETKKLTVINSKLFEKKLNIILNEIELMNSQHICVTQPHKFVYNFSNNKKGIPSVFGENFSGLDFDYSLNALNEVMKNLCGKYFIEIKNEELQLSHFYDGVHTNEKGSELLGKIIFEKMKKIELLDSM